MAITLNADEISALMDAIQQGRVPSEVGAPAPGASSAGVVAFDLTSSDRISRGQMPTLDAINEQLASHLGSGLGGRVRIPLKLVSSPSALLKFVEVLPMLAPPSTVAVLELGKRYGPGLAVLEAGLADALLGAALGDRRQRPDGAAALPPTRRDLTAVDRTVLKRLLGTLTEAMTRAWAPVLPLTPEVTRFEMDPRMAQVAPATEAVILSSFEFTEGMRGKLHIVIPFTAVESEKKALTSPPRVGIGAGSRFTPSLVAELEQVPVDVQVVLGRTTLNVSRLLELKPGDVLCLDTDESSTLDVLVEGRAKLSGSPRVSGANLALVVKQALDGFAAGTARSTPDTSAPLPLPRTAA